MIGFVYAVFAGFWAATASTCAKLAMSPELQRNFWCDLLLQRVAESSSLSPVCETIVIISRVLSFLLVFFFNALMWTMFVKSLRGSSSSATATVINTGSNFICTALLGCLLFSEALTLRWWLGTSLILTGLILIHYNSVAVTKEHSGVKKE